IGLRLEIIGMRITQITVSAIIRINEPLRASLVDMSKDPTMYPAASTTAPMSIPKYGEMLIPAKP
ncbi:unnamed protein product, partial [Rotaria magnacalcarata]